jgi:hypothetical protein
MAITRAQQAKQMLQDGGRIGLRFGSEGYQGGRTDQGGAGPGPGNGGGQGRDTDFQQRGMSALDYAGMSPATMAENFRGRDITLPGISGLALNVVRDFIDRSKLKRGARFPGEDEMAKDRIAELIDQQRDESDGSQIVLPIIPKQEPIITEQESEEDEGLRLAFRADGGRIGAQEGGIMPRLNQLGSGVSSAEQMLQEINQRLESAESSLGSGGGMQQPFMGRPDFEAVVDPSAKPQQLQQADPNSPLLGIFQSRPENTSGPMAAIPSGVEVLQTGIPAAGYADGGNVVGGEFDFESARQMYGLGKLVKKVTRTVKKIAKSPIGKAAIIGAGFGFAGMGPFKGLASTPLGTGITKNFLKFKGSPIGEKIFGKALADDATRSGGLLDMIGGKAGLGILGVSALAGLLTPEQEDEAQALADNTGIDIEEARQSILRAGTRDDFRARAFRAEGGSMKEPVAKKTMPLLDLDGKEMDLRAEGGFVPIGRMEKADDVPARLSKNEFVFTADAVRNAGDGNVDKGAEVMYNMMKNLEAGGDVSEESQGLEGARRMFQTSKRLEEVL